MKSVIHTLFLTSQFSTGQRTETSPVLSAVEQDTVGILAIAPGAPRFLIKTIQTFLSLGLGKISYADMIDNSQTSAERWLIFWLQLQALNVRNDVEQNGQ